MTHIINVTFIDETKKENDYDIYDKYIECYDGNNLVKKGKII
jgi:hypothetical protein